MYLFKQAPAPATSNLIQHTNNMSRLHHYIKKTKSNKQRHMHYNQETELKRQPSEENRLRRRNASHTGGHIKLSAM